MEIKIEKVTKDDVKEIHDLAMKTPELWDSDEPGYLSTDELTSLIESPDDVFIKATVDGEFAGYMITTYHKYLRGAYFMDISIKEEYRKQGIANLFFTETEKILKEKGCNWVWALVFEKNVRMQQIMEKKGFFKGRKWFTYYKEI